MNLLVSLLVFAALLVTLVVAWANGFASPAARRQFHYNAQGKLSLVGRMRLALTALFVRFAPVSEGNLTLANVGEGQSLTGLKTFLSDSAFGTRFRLGKIGSTAQNIAIINAATDKPLAVVSDEAAIGDPVSSAVLGAAAGTLKIAINSTVTFGDSLTPDATGYGRTLPTADGVYWIFGTALQSGVAGDVIEFTPCFPRQIQYATAVATSRL